MSVVDDFRTAVTNFALTQQNNAVTNADNVLGAWSNIVLPTVSYTPANVNVGFLAGMTAPAAPTLPSISAVSPQRPALDAISAPVFEAAPSFTLAAPVVTLPESPGATMPNSPGQAPTFNAPAIPPSPVFSLPAVPTLQSLAIPAAPTVSIPTFSSALPTADLVAPTAVFSYVERDYSSSLLDAMKTKLMSDLVNGGYGIEPADEDALWNRAREREMRNCEASIQDAARQMAARGFAAPPGAMFAQMDAIRQAAMERASDLSREIALKRADLYVENRKFTIAQIRDVEQMLIAYWGSMMERSLNAAKAVVETGIATYNAQVAAAQYRLDRYKAAGQVYEVVLKAALANLEAYKAQVEGLKLAADVQRIYADVYRTQLEGVNALANIYRTQMDGAKTQAEIEQLKLQAFKAVVETYTAQVGAKQAEFGMYESRVKGEMAKVSVFQAQVAAYGEQINAFRAKAQAAQVMLEAHLAPNKLKVDTYQADISRYSADVHSSQIALSSALGLHESKIRGFVAETSAAVQNANVWVSASKANAEIAAANAKLQGDLAVSRGQLGVASANAFATIQGHLAGSFASLAGSAISSAGSLNATIATG